MGSEPMFLLAGIVGWTFGGLAGAETGWWGIDLYLHNALNIVGHLASGAPDGKCIVWFGYDLLSYPGYYKKEPWKYSWDYSLRIDCHRWFWYILTLYVLRLRWFH